MKKQPILKTLAVTAVMGLFASTAYAEEALKAIGPNGELLARAAVSTSDYTSGTGVSGSNNVARYRGNSIDDPANRGTTGRDVITGAHGSRVGVGTERAKGGYVVNSGLARPLTVDQLAAVDGRVVVQGKVTALTGTDMFVLSDARGNSVVVQADAASANIREGNRVNVVGSIARTMTGQNMIVDAEHVVVLN